MSYSIDVQTLVHMSIGIIVSDTIWLYVYGEYD